MARRLRLVRYGGDLFADEAIEQRRFPGVRPPDQRDVTAPISVLLFAIRHHLLLLDNFKTTLPVRRGGTRTREYLLSPDREAKRAAGRVRQRGKKRYF